MADGTELTLDQLVSWLQHFQQLVAANRDYLTELDSAIGDADHGANLDRGLNAVLAKFDATPPVDAADLFKRTGMTLVSTVGGASGPLYGTFFLRVGTAIGTTLGEVQAVPASALAEALHAGLDGVAQRGKAEPGDKTMLDALIPALDAFDAAADSSVTDAAHAAFEAAAAGRDATEPLVAHKGRASYLGDRSAGHLDPGATSTALLFQALDEAVTGK